MAVKDCPCPKVIDWYDHKPRKGFDRHDLKGSVRYLGKLRPMGRRRRWDFEGGKYDSGHPNRYYGVRSTAFEALYGARGYSTERQGVYLDAGCGDSPDADIALVTGYSKAYCVDLYRPLIHISDKDYAGWVASSPMRVQAEFILGDICERLPIRAGSIDAISSNWVIPLMSMADRLMFYKQAYRMLKKNGYFVIAADTLTSGYNHVEDFAKVERGSGGVFKISNELPRLEQAGFQLTRRDVNCLVLRKRA